MPKPAERRGGSICICETTYAIACPRAPIRNEFARSGARAAVQAAKQTLQHGTRVRSTRRVARRTTRNTLNFVLRRRHRSGRPLGRHGHRRRAATSWKVLQKLQIRESPPSARRRTKEQLDLATPNISGGTAPRGTSAGTNRWILVVVTPADLRRRLNAMLRKWAPRARCDRPWRPRSRKPKVVDKAEAEDASSYMNKYGSQLLPLHE